MTSFVRTSITLEVVEMTSFRTSFTAEVPGMTNHLPSGGDSACTRSSHVNLSVVMTIFPKQTLQPYRSVRICFWRTWYSSDILISTYIATTRFWRFVTYSNGLVIELLSDRASGRE